MLPNQSLKAIILTGGMKNCTKKKKAIENYRETKNGNHEENDVSRSCAGNPGLSFTLSKVIITPLVGLDDDLV
ncbi:Uncharacterized protein TCM_014670 [Theobroma cacao]|uniref:Uncharacterized protein n=1 Tax=Theobroma cacao TaxID=3641 RepID=A0A061G656_THECC|nr:Uncharacterized protein TCM_014670 [Theobroma cacao]